MNKSDGNGGDFLDIKVGEFKCGLAPRIIGPDHPVPKKVALRFNEGKIPLVFILDFPNAVAGLCKVKEKGAEKYALHNWKRGRTFRDTLSSLLRHLYASQSEALDQETGLPHIDHVMWNAMALAEWYRTHPELNDWGPDL